MEDCYVENEKEYCIYRFQWKKPENILERELWSQNIKRP